MKVQVLFYNTGLMGVYTTHQKAMQAMLLDALDKGWKLVEYMYDMGVEFFTFDRGDELDNVIYEMQEVSLNERA